MAVILMATSTVNGVLYALGPVSLPYQPGDAYGGPDFYLVAGQETIRIASWAAADWLAARDLPNPEEFIRECLEAFDRHPNLGGFHRG